MKLKTKKKKLLELIGLSNEVFELFRFELNIFFVEVNSMLNPVNRTKINQYSKQSNIRLNLGAGQFREMGVYNNSYLSILNLKY